jgi:hypothetical protein
MVEWCYLSAAGTLGWGEVCALIPWCDVTSVRFENINKNEQKHNIYIKMKKGEI